MSDVSQCVGSFSDWIRAHPCDLWASLVAQLIKASTWNAGDPALIPGSGRSTGEGIGYSLQYFCASLVAQLVKNLPAMQETWV